MKPSIKAKSTRKEKVIRALVLKNAKPVGKTFEDHCIVRCVPPCGCYLEPEPE